MRFKPFFALVVLSFGLVMTSPVQGRDSPLERLRQRPLLPSWPAVAAPTVTELAQVVPTAVQVQDVPVIGMTVSDIDEAMRFYSEVLTFEKISDVEVFGREVELLQGIFGARIRVVQMRLGREVIELTEYLTPQGRSIPMDSRSNDLWFQHIAIVVSDMDAAYGRLRDFNVQHVSTAPQRLQQNDYNRLISRSFLVV